MRIIWYIKLAVLSKLKPKGECNGNSREIAFSHQLGESK